MDSFTSYIFRQAYEKVSRLGELDKRWNRRIGSRRRPVERTLAVIKRVFHGGRVLVTSLPRVRVKLVFSCLCFNLLQLGSLGVGS